MPTAIGMFLNTYPNNDNTFPKSRVHIETDTPFINSQRRPNASLLHFTILVLQKVKIKSGSHASKCTDWPVVSNCRARDFTEEDTVKILTIH